MNIKKSDRCKEVFAHNTEFILVGIIKAPNKKPFRN